MPPIGRVLLSTKTEVAIYQLAAATDFGEIRKIIDENPALLSDLALDKMRRVVADQIDPRARSRVAERVALIEQCRKLGVERVFGGAFPALQQRGDDRSTE